MLGSRVLPTVAAGALLMVTNWAAGPTAEEAGNGEAGNGEAGS